MKAFRKLFFITFLASGLLCLISSCSNSNDYEIFGAIHGRVTDYETGAPLDNATLTLSPSGLSKQTDASGYYEFKNLEPMQYTITIQHQGYQPNRKTVYATSGEDHQVDAQLRPIPEN
ncbi:MAG: carboxypeptidase-like regulatory domain-containing protein [Duncaniella sp.]|nr:carboxypeptidase-like regulatory domain-containing protein [Duncaniella sp.]